MRCAILLFACLTPLFPAERRRPVYPAAGAKPVGPYSPGIQAGDSLYVSGQGARDAAGTLPATFEEQARQCLANVKGVVEAGGLTMEDVVYSQVYLAEISQLDALVPVWNQFFPRTKPPFAVVGTANMPTGTPVEISAVAVRGGKAAGRAYFSGQGAGNPEGALRKFGKSARLAFVNAYLTAGVSDEQFEAAWRRRFPGKSAPARAVIRVAALPGGAAVELTGVAATEKVRRVSNCAWAGNQLYCSARPGAGATVEDQVRDVMRSLAEDLKAAGLSFANVVATNVYLDDIGDFAKMNAVYAQSFGSAPPTRTTVQPFRSEGRRLVQISLVAVR